MFCPNEAGDAAGVSRAEGHEEVRDTRMEALPSRMSRGPREVGRSLGHGHRRTTAKVPQGATSTRVWGKVIRNAAKAMNQRVMAPLREEDVGSGFHECTC